MLSIFIKKLGLNSLTNYKLQDKFLHLNLQANERY